MATNYTTVLKLALPTTGELVGSWGSVVNNQITQMVEQAITGIATVNTWVGASHTLTTANGTTSESRCAILQCSGAPGSAAQVICPAQPKIYILKNGVSGGYAVTLKTSAGTGIAVPNGKVMWLYCDGTNVVEATSHLVSLTLATPLAASSGGTGVANSYDINLGGALSISGALSILGNDAVTINTSANTNLTFPTSGTLITATGSDTITNKDISGLTNNIHDVSLVSDVIDILPVTFGGLGDSVTPANGQIPIGNGTDYTIANIISGAGITVIGGVGTIEIAATGAGSVPGDVVGPISATDNAIVRFDGTSGKVIQNSTATVTDAGFLTANGLTFPAVQVSSADVNTLDDYEEGTWTPTYASIDIFYGDITLTYPVNGRVGRYRKVGAVVFIEFQIYTSSVTVTGATSDAISIDGLPFAPISGFPISASQIVINQNNGWTTNAPSNGTFSTTAWFSGFGSIYLSYKTSPNALTQAAITGANLTTGSVKNQVYANGFYFTAT